MEGVVERLIAVSHREEGDGGLVFDLVQQMLVVLDRLARYGVVHWLARETADELHRGVGGSVLGLPLPSLALEGVLSLGPQRVLRGEVLFLGGELRIVAPINIQQRLPSRTQLYCSHLMKLCVTSHTYI